MPEEAVADHLEVPVEHLFAIGHEEQVAAAVGDHRRADGCGKNVGLCSECRGIAGREVHAGKDAKVPEAGLLHLPRAVGMVGKRILCNGQGRCNGSKKQ